MSEKTPWQKWKEAQGESRPWDLLNPSIKRVTPEIYEYRFEKNCLECPFLIKLTTTCKKCGCFMREKAKLANAGCPMGKWGPVVDKEGMI